MFPGQITQLSGRLAITGEIDPQSSAAIVRDIADWSVKGVYIDDDTPPEPGISHWISMAVGRFDLILVSIAPQQYGKHYSPRPPVQEMYEDYESRTEIAQHDHVIIPWHFQAPSKKQRLAKLSNALDYFNADHIWLY